MDDPKTAYPSERVAHVALRDGSTVYVRPIRPEDGPAILEFYRSLSQESRAFRFFSPGIDLAAAARREVAVDYHDTFGLAALAGPERRIVGIASYYRTSRERAEVAFTIADDYQGLGLGTILLGQIAEAAAANGIPEFEALVLPENYRMLGVFRDSGFPIEVRTGFEEIVVTFPTSLTEAAIASFERREQTSASNALRAILSPRSVAVIGASRQLESVSGALFHNLLRGLFAGPVYPVNRSADVVQSVRAYPSVSAIPDQIDLAVIAVPASEVISVAKDCGQAGVRALIVISNGFAEIGPEGAERQNELLAVCRQYGMRMIGPNCFGAVNTDPDVRLDAIFGPLAPLPGRIGFGSQSGALGLAVIDYTRTLGLGISSFVSVGNKADISGNDLLHYWESDDRTDVILLYLESFGNPQKFARIARRIAKQKPIVVVKSGRSSAGVRTSASRTDNHLASSDVTVDALFHQSGVIRTDTLEEMFDVASLLASQPLPQGRRVGIITNGAGPAILCVDAAEAQDLEVPVLTERSQQRLRELLPPEATVTNPVDLIATATGDRYKAAIETVAADPNVDALIVIFLPPLPINADEVTRSILAAAEALQRSKPILAVYISSHGMPASLKLSHGRVPAFAFPESAAIALGHAVRYREWRERPVEPPVRLENLSRDEAAALVARALGAGGGWLNPREVGRLLACYGLPLPEQELVATPEEAGAAAARMGGSVVLKAVISGLTHKREAGAVALNLQGEQAVREAAEAMAQRLEAADQAYPAFLVQRMLPQGVNMLAGIIHDPQFGAVIACGAGGILADLMNDVSFRLAPLSQQDAREMIRELKSFRLLAGYQGRPFADVAALEDILLRLSAMAEDLPQIAELDCNPVVVFEQGALIVNVRVRVEAAAPPRPLGARR